MSEEEEVDSSYKLIKVSFIITWEDLLQSVHCISLRCCLWFVCRFWYSTWVKESERYGFIFEANSSTQTYPYKSLRGCKICKTSCWPLSVEQFGGVLTIDKMLWYNVYNSYMYVVLPCSLALRQIKSSTQQAIQTCMFDYIRLHR